MSRRPPQVRGAVGQVHLVRGSGRGGNPCSCPQRQTAATMSWARTAAEHCSLGHGWTRGHVSDRVMANATDRLVVNDSCVRLQAVRRAARKHKQASRASDKKCSSGTQGPTGALSTVPLRARAAPPPSRSCVRTWTPTSCSLLQAAAATVLSPVTTRPRADVNHVWALPQRTGRRSWRRRSTATARRPSSRRATQQPRGIPL